MKILSFEKGKEPEIKEIDGSLKSMKEIIEGYIETIYLGNKLILVCNEEGKLRRLEPTLKLDNNYIYGNCFICEVYNDELTSISEQNLKLLKNILYI